MLFMLLSPFDFTSIIIFGCIYFNKISSIYFFSLFFFWIILIYFQKKKLITILPHYKIHQIKAQGILGTFPSRFSVKFVVRFSYKTTSKKNKHCCPFLLTIYLFVHFTQRHPPIRQLWLLTVRDQRKPWLFKMRIANPFPPSSSLSVLYALSQSCIFYLSGLLFIHVFTCVCVFNSNANRSHACC
jgi:hypothetical protein